MKGKMQGIGALMIVVGGAGLAEISTSSHGNFIICATIFAIGFGLCLAGYIND